MARPSRQVAQGQERDDGPSSVPTANHLKKQEAKEELITKKALSASELLQFQTTQAVAEARYNSALNSVRDKIAQIGVREAELLLARESLADAIVSAPFDGRVQLKSVSPGAFVRVGDALVTLVKTDLLRFRGIIPERYALKLKLGQEVQLQVE